MSVVENKKSTSAGRAPPKQADIEAQVGQSSTRAATATTTTTIDTHRQESKTKLPSRCKEDATGSIEFESACSKAAAAKSNKRPVHISDLLGEYGNYQLFLTLLTFVRYLCLAMMTNTGPLIAPSLTYWCQAPPSLQINDLRTPLDAGAHANGSMVVASDHGGHHNGTSVTLDEVLRNKCSLEFKNGTHYQCRSWTYDQTKTGVTLTGAFDLVCERDWLRSAFQSSISIGMAIATVIFGAASDEHGRRPTMFFCMVLSLLAGLASYLAPNFRFYTLARSLCTMCDLCLAGALYTIIVETLGNKYRGVVCLIVTTGWSIGVMIMPWVTSYFLDFRRVMLFTVACHMVTLPFLLIVGESPRWLLINGKFKEVRKEIVRISAKWNRKTTSELEAIDENFDLLRVKYSKRLTKSNNQQQKDSGLAPRVYRTFLGGFSKIDQIFKSKELFITTLMFIWIIFNSELLYMIFIFVNSDHDSNIKLNYAIGGLMETLATIIGIVMISSLSRRVSLSLTLTIISTLMVGLAFTHDQPLISVYSLNVTKLAASTLTSLVFVIITELFPTSLRQTGTGIASTLGSCGAIIAPFIHNELSALIGFKNVLLVLCLLPLTAAILIPFFLRETKGVELADDIDDIES